MRSRVRTHIRCARPGAAPLSRRRSSLALCFLAPLLACHSDPVRADVPAPSANPRALVASALPLAPPSASAPAPPPDPENRGKPPAASGDLTERARHLFDAIVKNDPALADEFFFPRDPFVPLKDVRDPARYHAELLAAYHRDVRELHASLKDWSGASFASFELGTAPTWVAPGKEYNKIGYYRTFHGKLRYRMKERSSDLDVATIISWDGRWYVTHLSPIRHGW